MKENPVAKKGVLSHEVKTDIAVLIMRENIGRNCRKDCPVAKKGALSKGLKAKVDAKSAMMSTPWTRSGHRNNMKFE